MKVAIHQPEYLPWLGYFHKMVNCDKYVILDNVQFAKNNWQNRNLLCDKKGNTFWSTVPVKLSGNSKQLISEIKIDYVRSWQNKLYEQIRHSYGKAKYFNIIDSELKDIFFKSHENLIDLNLEIINLIMKYLEISTPIIKASEIGAKGRKSELLLDICKKLNASSYYSGPSGKNYLNIEIFQNHKISVEFQEFIHPEYFSPFFIKNLSSLDLIMHNGPKSIEIIRN